ncbi:MAG: LptF/LptG family permease [Gemmatirosa sp.]
MKITTKYVLREHLGPLTFALSALTSLLLLNYISRKFGDLVGKGLPWRVIGEFFVLSIPFTVAMTLPMAVLVSVLYAFSRLASENEITAFKASGVSMSRLLAPVLVAAVGLAGIMVYFNDQVLPRANHRLTVLTGDIARTRPTFALREQVLNEVTPQLVLRASRVDQQRSTLKDVTIYDMSRPELRTIRADSGELALSKDRKDLEMTLHDGVIENLGENKPNELQRLFYQTNLIRVKDVAKSFTQTDQNGTNFKSDREMSICELQNAYLRSRKEYLIAKLEFDQAMADSLRRKRPEAAPPGKVFLGIGRLYCQAVNGVKEVVREVAPVRTAGAMETAQPPVPAQPPAQDTTRRPATPAPAPQQPPAPAPVPTPTPAVPVPVPAQTPVPVTPTPVPAPPVPAPQDVAPRPPAPPATQPSRADTAALPGGVVVPVPGQPDSAAAAAAAAALPPTPTGTPAADSAAPAIAHGSMLAIARLRLAETGTQMNGYDIEIHKKFALAVACIVFVLLGAPVALRFPRGGVGLVIGMSLFVFALYYCFLIAGEELATRGMLPTWVSMWAANVLFGLAGLALAARMGRESGSGRGGGLGEWWYMRRHRKQLRLQTAARAASRGTA